MTVFSTGSCIFNGFLRRCRSVAGYAARSHRDAGDGRHGPQQTVPKLPQKPPARGAAERQAGPGNERSALVTERGLPSRLCLLRQISFKLKTQPTPQKENKTTLCLRRGAAWSAQGRRRARVRLPAPRRERGPHGSRRARYPAAAQARTPAAASPDPNRGEGRRAGPGEAGPRRGASSEGSHGGQRARRTQASLRTRQARNDHPPHGNKTSAFAGTGRSPSAASAPRAWPSGAGVREGRARAAALRPEPRGGGRVGSPLPGALGRAPRGRRGSEQAAGHPSPADPDQTRPDPAASTPPPPPNVRLQPRGDGAVERAQSPRACEPRRY